MLDYYSDKEKGQVESNLLTFLEEANRVEGNYLWVILEVLANESFKKFIEEYEESAYPLFDTLAEPLAQKGAFAIAIHETPQLLELVTSMWGGEYFCIFSTPFEKEDLLSHFKSLAIAKREDRSYIFRFYDPATMLSWVQGLEDDRRVQEALGIFPAIYVETAQPHLIMQCNISEHGIDIESINLIDKSPKAPSKHGCKSAYPLYSPWQMSERELQALSVVAYKNFKAKLCRTLPGEYPHLRGEALIKLYRHIDGILNEAIKHGIKRKDVLAHLADTAFRYEEFWFRYRDRIEQILAMPDIDETERVEYILSAARRWSMQQNKGEES